MSFWLVSVAFADPPCPEDTADLIFEGRVADVQGEPPHYTIVFDVANGWRGLEPVEQITVRHVADPFPFFAGNPTFSPPPWGDWVIYAAHDDDSPASGFMCHTAEHASTPAIVLARERLGPPQWQRALPPWNDSPDHALQRAIRSCDLPTVARLRGSGVALPHPNPSLDCVQAKGAPFADALLRGDPRDPRLPHYLLFDPSVARRALLRGLDVSWFSEEQVCNLVPLIPDDAQRAAVRSGLGPCPKRWVWAMEHPSPVLKGWAVTMPLTPQEAGQLLWRVVDKPRLIRHLLDRGAPPEGGHPAPATIPPIAYAALSGCGPCVEMLWNAGSHPSNLLAYASPALVDQFDEMEGWGLDLDARDQWGMTALGRAICYGEPEVAISLVERGASVDTPTDRRDGPPVSLAMDTMRCYPKPRRGGSEAIVTTLLHAGLSPQDALPWAADRTWVSWLVKRGAKLHSPQGRDLLAYAAGERRRWLIDWLLTQGVDLHGTTTRGWPVLAQAVAHWRFVQQYGRDTRVAGIQALLDAGADPDAPTPEGHTARSLARTKQDDQLRALLKNAPPVR